MRPRSAASHDVCNNTYLLLQDNRRIADVLHDYEVRGAENKLLLKRRRFDSTGADFSKPQFIALTEVRPKFSSISANIWKVIERGLILRSQLWQASRLLRQLASPEMVKDRDAPSTL